MPSSNLIHLLTRPTFGLKTDTKVIERALVDKFNIRTFFPQGRNFDLAHRRCLYRLTSGFRQRRTARVNIFSEQIMPGWLPLADRNVLVVNQEWCRDETLAQLKKIDLVICKTSYADGIFRGLGYKTALTGFSSLDRFDGSIAKNHNQFLHVAGRSRQKGTKTLLDVWCRHPEWPQLTVVTTSLDLIPENLGSNITVLSGVVDDEVLFRLQNSAGIHICTSEAEGYGHYIGEAMSCGAIVMATDAPPMNELVAPGRGFLVGYHRTAPQSLGTNFYVCPEALERRVQEVLQLDAAQRVELGNAARTWFLSNRQSFEDRIRSVVTDLVNGA
jgi:glycosyltransferase involved in cell wall biosynthesis